MKNVYEFNDVSGLKILFINSIKKSVQDYSNIVSTLVTPSDIQIKYREEIKSFVRECVLGDIAPHQLELSQFPPQVSENILKEVQSELKSLHEGSLVRFGLRLSEFERWKNNSKKINKCSCFFLIGCAHFFKQSQADRIKPELCFSLRIFYVNRLHELR